MPFAQGRNDPEGQQAEATSLLPLLHDAAARAAEFIRAHTARRGEITWEHKGPADYVSFVDRGAEDAVRAVLLGAHPDAGFLGEESYDPSIELGTGLTFVVDPLDGTTNFLHGFPWYAVSIAATRGGEPIAGVILNVPTGETFSASLGGGAWRETAAGRERIAVSSNDVPARALVGTGFPFKGIDRIDEYLRHFTALTRQAAGIRRPGAAALDLCDVACGRFDAFWELTLMPWDIAAGIVIIREAGGVVTDLDGAPPVVRQTGLVAGGPAMHAWLMDTLRNA